MGTKRLNQSQLVLWVAGTAKVDDRVLLCWTGYGVKAHNDPHVLLLCPCSVLPRGRADLGLCEPDLGEHGTGRPHGGPGGPAGSHLQELDLGGVRFNG